MRSMAMEMAMAIVVVAVAVWLGLAGDGVSGEVVQFIFGDSLSDVGNNNYLSKSLAKASLPWYGIDFGSGMPNGRFTNGRTVADILGDMMGFPCPSSFLDPSLTVDSILSKGVNYASGGAGILNETSSLFIQRLSFYKQIELFEGTQRIVRAEIGDIAAEKFFTEASYSVVFGSNDYINNYLLPIYGDSWSYTGNSFTVYLLKTLDKQLQILHSLGARRLIFIGLGPMGCIPLQRFMTTSGECQEKSNKLALSFNNGARRLLDTLSSGLPNATFRYGDAYDLVRDVIRHPRKHGFSNSDSPCCTVGKIRPSLTCTPISTLCKDRSKYVFWDEYHPTDRTNEIIANEIASQFQINMGFSFENGP